VALRNGFRRGFFAGAGAASADFLGALAVAGGIIADALAPVSGVLRTASGIVLVAMGAYGLRRIHPRLAPPKNTAVKGEGDLRTYLQFIGLTIVNPLTVAYFAAFIFGRGAAELSSWSARAAFVAGFGRGVCPSDLSAGDLAVPRTP
jgi:threonine/homoserine/homoserine lactone efflux protein